MGLLPAVGSIGLLYGRRIHRPSIRALGDLKTITSDRGSLFTSAFWSRLHQALGTALKYSTAYHPQTDGQTERVNQILEDMLRACTLAQGTKWEDCLPYVEFLQQQFPGQLKDVTL